MSLTFSHHVNKMELFHQSFNCHNFDHTKHKVYISFHLSRRVFLGLSAYKECVFSFKLFKWCTDCFSFMCELIMMAEAVFLEGYKKYCGVGCGQWGKNHTNLFKAYVLKIFFIEISKAIEIGIFFKWNNISLNVLKRTMLTAFRRIIID